MAYQKSNNPFLDDKDDDTGFGGASNRSVGYGGYDGSYGSSSRDPFAEPDDEPYYEKPLSPQELLQKRKEESMQRQMDSSKRALASIYDSERMGVATAEELVHQGEQLDNIERKNDQIQQDMKVSQRHINSIKSVFGGIKNWWQGKKEQPQAEPQQPPRSDTSERLQATMDNSRNATAQQHPAMRFKEEDVKGFYDEPDTGASGAASAGYSKQPAYGANRSQRMKEFDEKTDSNLDMMSDGMARLKMLAMGLGDEIERQNDQVDRINTSMETTNAVVKGQNQQISGILYGNKKK